MRTIRIKRSALGIPLALALGLIVSACGSNGSGPASAQEAPASAAVAPMAAPADPAPAGAPAVSQPAAKSAAAPATKSATSTTPKAAPAQAAPAVPVALAVPVAPVAAPSKVKAPAASAGAAAAGTPATVHGRTAVDQADALSAVKADTSAENQKIYDQKQGVTDVGISKDSIRLGSVNMHGMALGNVITAPMVRGNLATAAAINDRGGVLGRRIQISDCDDGPGEVSRAKACVKKLAGEDRIFSLVSGIDWATASIHDDLKQYQLPYVGAWAYSQTEWQDPYMFPTHMSMIHEAMSGGHWAANVVKPKTYGLICLTSPEMQLACDQVQKILDATGAKMVKRADVAISEISMSAYVLAFRAAAPEHIIHYVINPATMAKFMIEANQQGYYPPKGISGNHLAAEALGPLFGNWPAWRYWTNTTYVLWGNEFMATMNKYALANKGGNHHIVQAGYTGINIFAQAAKAVGPNLTRQRLMAELGNGTVWRSDASLDQRFSYVPSERTGDNWDHEMGQGREFMYKMESTNTRSNPDGSPNGFRPDPDQFVIHTWK